MAHIRLINGFVEFPIISDYFFPLLFRSYLMVGLIKGEQAPDECVINDQPSRIIIISSLNLKWIAN